MASSIDLRALITQQAVAQGVPPQLALAVAQQESGINQGAIGSKGEIGTFQLMPSSFPGQDLADVYNNVSLGVGYLAQLYNRYGDWSTALAAYNWGPGNVDSGRSIPSVVWGYVRSILGMAGAPTPATSQSASVSSDPLSFDSSATPSDLQGSVVGINPNMLVVGGLVAVGVLAWWWAD